MCPELHVVDSVWNVDGFAIGFDGQAYQNFVLFVFVPSDLSPGFGQYIFEVFVGEFGELLS